ncbi:MAG: DUF6588 family protein [Calditrichaceae bacterium]
MSKIVHRPNISGRIIYSVFFTFVVILIVLSGFLERAYAGDLKGELEKIILESENVEENLKGYLNPFSEIAGTSMSTGIFHRAAANSFPHINLGINVINTDVPSGSRYFTDNNGIKHSTIFGDEKINSSDSFNGFGKNRLSLPIATFSIGLFTNFEFTLRYTKWDISEIGDISLFGGGIKYELIEMTPGSLIPVEMSVMASYHFFHVDDYLESGAFGMNLIVSRGFQPLPLNIYAGIGYVNSLLLLYTDKIVESGADFGEVSVDGVDGLRYQVGMGFNVMMFNIHADYNFGEYDSFSAGILLEL